MTDTAETPPYPELCPEPDDPKEVETTQNAQPEEAEEDDEPRLWRRREYRTQLEHEGYTIDAIAAKFRERWGFGILRSYRLANGLTMSDAVFGYNDLFDLSRGRPGFLHNGVLGKYETYLDTPSARRPIISVLVGLAIIYGTQPRRLLDPAARHRYSPADLYLLDTYRPPLLPPSL